MNLSVLRQIGSKKSEFRHCQNPREKGHNFVPARPTGSGRCYKKTDSIPFPQKLALAGYGGVSCLGTEAWRVGKASESPHSLDDFSVLTDRREASLEAGSSDDPAIRTVRHLQFRWTTVTKT